MKACNSFLFALTLLPLSAAPAQQSERKELERPQLKLELIPGKPSYREDEKAKLTFRLTSLSDGTLCFPRPMFEESGTSSGYLSFEARSLTGAGVQDVFINDVWPRHPSEEKLRANVTGRWIKLGMSEPYQQKEHKTWGLSPGDWSIEAIYHPPELNARDQEIVESLGCTAPSKSVSSASVTIHIEYPQDIRPEPGITSDIP